VGGGWWVVGVVGALVWNRWCWGVTGRPLLCVGGRDVPPERLYPVVVVGGACGGRGGVEEMALGGARGLLVFLTIFLGGDIMSIGR